MHEWSDNLNHRLHCLPMLAERHTGPLNAQQQRLSWVWMMRVYERFSYR